MIGQALHLAGDHGETFTHFPGPGGFDRRVQRQQVGLAGDTFDQLGDGAGLRRGGTQLVHDTPGLLGQVGGLAGQVGALLGIGSDALDGLGDLIQGGRNTLNIGRHFLGRAGQGDDGFGDLLRSGGDTLRPAGHLVTRHRYPLRGAG